MNFPSSDSASVYSSVSSNMEPRTSRDCLTPRSSYTPDLYELPVNRIKPKHYRKHTSQRSLTSASTQSLSLIPEKQPMPQHFGPFLTPYQIQRNQMRKSFQFANGENFTPKQKLSRAAPQTNHSLPKSASCSNFHPAPPVGTLRPSPMSQSKRNSFTNLSSIPAVQGRLGFPKSASTSRLPVLSASCINKPPGFVTNTNNGSKASLQSVNKTSSDSSTVSSRAQAVSSNTSTSNSSNSLKSENVVSSNTSSGTNEGDNSRTAIQVVLASKSSSNTTLPVLSSVNAAKLEEKAPNSKSFDTGVSSLPKKATPQNQLVLGDKASINREHKGVKRSGSRIGAFFKKLLPFKKKKQLQSIARGSPIDNSMLKKQVSTQAPTISISNKECTASTLVPSSSPSKECEIRPSVSPVKESESEQDFDDFELNDDEDDDMLMDIDLVFDSLLLKNTRPAMSPIIHNDTCKVDAPKQQLQAVRTETSKSTEDEPMIDYELVSEFSRLGNYIISKSSQSNNGGLIPPPRSIRRPQLSDKDSAVGFYRQHAVQSSKRLQFGERLLQNLHRDWEVVNVNCKIADVPPLLDSTKPVQSSLRFSNVIYVNDTYSPAEYERSDKKFIKNRRRMMQMQNMAYIKAVKVQLNEYKRKDMVVHADSISNTHLFI